MTTFIELVIGDTIQYTDNFETKTSKIIKISNYLLDDSQLFVVLADNYTFNHFPYNDLSDIDIELIK